MANYENANYIYNSNGVIIPDTADIKTDIQAEYQEALGNDLSLEDSTPQGRLIDVETTARANTLSFNATVANSLINIMMASGSALDSWGADFGIYRNGATASQVTATVTGVIDTVIPQGSQAQDVNGILWTSESDIVIGSNGTATGLFICSQTGAISLGIGELNTIVASGTLGVDGWETITNNSAAILGSAIESDNSFKTRIIQSLFSGSALFGNYQSAVMKVDNVTASYAKENPYGEALILDNITLPPHSVYVCVQGGNSYDVAYALYSVKSGGCGWAGNTTVVVTDKTYFTENTVKYQIPDNTNFVIDVSLTSGINTSADLSGDIKQVIVNYFNGIYSDYVQPQIRGVIDPFIIATVIKSQIEGITINDLKVGLLTVKNHAIAGIIKASAVGGITWASVDDSIFATAVNNVNGNYIFTFDGTNWNLSNEVVTLSDYGITVTDTPITNDKVTVLYSNGNMSNSPIQIYANEYPIITTSNITVNING